MKYTIKEAQVKYYINHYWSKEPVDINVKFAKDTYYGKKFHRPYDILIKDECEFKPFSDLFYLGDYLIQIPVLEKEKIKQELIFNEYRKANNSFIIIIIVLSLFLVLCL